MFGYEPPGEGSWLTCEKCGYSWQLTKEDTEKDIVTCPKCSSDNKN